MREEVLAATAVRGGRYNEWRVGAMSVRAWGKEVALVWERGEKWG